MKKTMKLLAADCGGTRIKLGLIDDRAIVSTAVIDAHASEPIVDRLEEIAKCFEGLCAQQGWQIADCGAIMLALPVIVAPNLREITKTFGKFDDAAGYDFASWADERFGLPVILENDARAAAIGEWTCGSGRGVKNMVMVTLGTGVGTGVICEGAPLRGRSGMAGNLGGHTVTHLGGATCPCGVQGCLEAQVGSWVLPGLIRSHPDFSTNPLSNEEVLDYQVVFRHAEMGNLLARELRDRAFEGWAALLINLIHGYDPERIVIGGGIMKEATLILPILQSIVNRQATQPAGRVEIVSADLGDFAALLGAPWLCEHLTNQSSMG